jgi:hypothetical protein
MRLPFADRTEKVACIKSANKPSHTKVVRKISTNFVGCTK